MTLQRRSFLAGIFVGAAAPAIVRASSLMKIWVPPQDIKVYGADSLSYESLPLTEGWTHYAIARESGELREFVNGGQITVTVDRSERGDFTVECWHRRGPDGRILIADWKTTFK